MSVHKSTGIIKYDPVNEKTTFKKWWCILQCDGELLRYYQHIYYKLHWKKLQTAIWLSHISIVRGEAPANLENWKLYDSKKIEFSYEYPGFFYSNKRHIWIKVWSDSFGDIRESLGLSREPMVGFHLSIGSLNND